MTAIVVTVDAEALEALMRAIRDVHTTVCSINPTPGDDRQAESVLNARMQTIGAMQRVSALGLGPCRYAEG